MRSRSPWPRARRWITVGVAGDVPHPRHSAPEALLARFDFQSLKDRKLLQWSAGYIGGAWLVLQLFDVVSEPLGWGAGAFAILVVVLVAGLPIVLVLAWYHGEQGRQRVSGPELIIIAALLAIAGTALHFVTGPVGGASGSEVGSGDAAGREPASPDTLSLKAVAVLPFANVSRDPEDQFFTDGMHEEVIARLARIRALRVISRTSVMQYRGAEENVRTIARELGVGTVLEGSVRRAGDQLRVTAQLIDARTDTHLWAETYDRVLSTENIFEVQTNIADRVARSLEASLTTAERTRIEQRPTDDLEAYEFYLRGLAVSNLGFTEANERRSIAMYEQAVELDPGFAEAWARLAAEHDNMIWLGYDRSEARERDAAAALERARELAPDHYQTVLTEAEHAYHRRRYAEAIERFERARSLRPNDAEAVSGLAFVRRRQGRVDETIRLLTRALTLDPRSATLAFNLGGSQQLMRRCDEAEGTLRQAIAWSPDWPRPHGYLALSRILCRGDVEGARATLESAYSVVPNPQDQPVLDRLSVEVDLMARNYDEALATVRRISEPILDSQFWWLPRSLLEAEVFDLAGRPDSAEARLHDALALLEPAAAERPDDERVRSALGLAYAYLGRHDEAIREGRRAVELMPYDVDAYNSSVRHADLARILVRVGEYDAAVEILEDLLDRPAMITPHQLRLDPRFDPIRDEPRFKELADRPVAPL